MTPRQLLAEAHLGAFGTGTLLAAGSIPLASAPADFKAQSHWQGWARPGPGLSDSHWPGRRRPRAHAPATTVPVTAMPGLIELRVIKLRLAH